MNVQQSIQPSIVSALAKALPELEGVKKNKDNAAFRGSKYADLAAVIDALEPIKEHGLWYRQHIHESEAGVNVETIYIHESGEQLSAGALFMPASKKDAQGFGSALTYARRYSLQTAFGLATEDDDGNAAVKAAGQSRSGEVSPPPAKKARRPANSALKTAYRGFVHEANGCGDGDEWSAFMATPDSVNLINSIKAELPHIWNGEEWPDHIERPEEFETLEDFINRRSRECANASAQYMTA